MITITMSGIVVIIVIIVAAVAGFYLYKKYKHDKEVADANKVREDVYASGFRSAGIQALGP